MVAARSDHVGGIELLRRWGAVDKPPMTKGPSPCVWLPCKWRARAAMERHSDGSAAPPAACA
eukprot:4053049-Pyramimonas_sp.AAC.1